MVICYNYLLLVVAGYICFLGLVCIQKTKEALMKVFFSFSLFFAGVGIAFGAPVAVGVMAIALALYLLS
jgi:hypothetical protein